MFLCQENQRMNGQNLGSSSLSIFGNVVLGHDCLKMRETILKHESVFRYQLLELHRLYGRQKELMDELRRGNDRYLVHEKFSVVRQASCHGDTEVSLCSMSRSPCNINAITLDLVSNGFAQNRKEVTNWEKESTPRHLPCNFGEKKTWLDHSGVAEFFPGNSSAFLQSQNAEPSRKRKLFGVEISEANEVSVDLTLCKSMSSTKDGNHQGSHCLTSWSFNSFVENGELEGAAGKDGTKEKSCWSVGCSSNGSNLFGVPFHKEESQTKYYENSDHFKLKPAENLPWFLSKLNEHDDLTKGMKSSYFMDMETLQQCKHSFFKNAENLKSAPEKFHGSMMSTTHTSIPERIQTQAYDKDSENEPIEVRISGCTSNLRHQIDLNLSLDEEESQAAHSFAAVVKITTTEIDLEPPVVDEEFDRLAAEAIIEFSQRKEQKRSVDVDAIACDLSEDGADLRWFAEVIVSELNETVTTQADEESIPVGMDHFEFMTLKLKDCKGKSYNYQSVIFDVEKGSDTIPTRTRRQSRRGKPRKDFQRDILPGMTTLSRVQVSEDLQSFEELMKAQGKGWQSGFSQRGTTRNSRGKKRMITPERQPKTKPICSSNAPQKPLWQLHERRLTGWGKRTRRLPRQRCPNGFVTFPIKC